MQERDGPERETDVSQRDDMWEQELLRRFRQGEGAAFGELLRHYQPRVFSLVFRLVGRREEAEEVMQEAFLQAFKSIGRSGEVRPFRPWLFRVAVNVCRNHRRAAWHREQASDVADGIQPMWQQGQETPEENVLAIEDVRRLEAAVERLSMDDASLFLLRCKEGMSYDELKQVLGSSESTLRVRYHRVVQRLRGLMFGGMQ